MRSWPRSRKPFAAEPSKRRDRFAGSSICRSTVRGIDSTDRNPPAWDMAGTCRSSLIPGWIPGKCEPTARQHDRPQIYGGSRRKSTRRSVLMEAERLEIRLLHDDRRFAGNDQRRRLSRSPSTGAAGPDKEIDAQTQYPCRTTVIATRTIHRVSTTAHRSVGGRLASHRRITCKASDDFRAVNTSFRH